MITSLTPEQMARFPEFVEKWTQIGLSIQPLNMKRVQQSLNKLALVSEKPIAIHRNARGQLHKDGALALAHSDGNHQRLTQ